MNTTGTQRNRNDARWEWWNAKTQEERRDCWRRWQRTYRAKKTGKTEAQVQERAARVDASVHNLVERAKGAILGHILTLVIASPPDVSRALLAWDSTPETGYI
jgi:hypothetical protein